MEYIKEIYAQYNKHCIRIYQAYNQSIAEEAIKLQTFGNYFDVNRMTWIKPSFLWMMYRSNWGTKKNQEYILALDIYREVFDRLLSQAILTSPDAVGQNGSEWEKTFEETAVYCQWDPDRNISGKAIQRAAIQIGLKGTALREFLDKGIYRISDMTIDVRKWNEQRKNGKLNTKDIPAERFYPVTDKTTRNRLNMR